MNDRAEALIRQLDLKPHPEGGYYREVFRSGRTVDPRDGRAERSAITVIYFLLAEGGCSRWHRVASDEVWCWVEGDALELFRLRDAEAEAVRERVGPPSDDAEPVRVVPAGEWQAARTTGAYTLVSCAVGPGFDFADFEMMSDLPAEAEAARRRGGVVADLV